MGTTTIHFPDDLLADLDRAAARHDVSRNRYVLNACQAALSREAGAWPEGFFDNHLSQADAEVLVEAAVELERDVYSRRRNRGAPVL
jgi:predicted transcriptional regulator